MLAGLLLVGALVLRGPFAGGLARREWPWLVAFAAAGGIGGHYPYACSEGLSASCRRLEWHLQLPLHHYIHVVSGIAEFAFLTVAVVLAVRRTRGSTTRAARVYPVLLRVLVVGYPLLGLVYLTDRLGTLVEPIFFVTFTAMALTEVFEAVGTANPPGPGAARPATAGRAMSPVRPAPAGDETAQRTRRIGPADPPADSAEEAVRARRTAHRRGRDARAHLLA